MRIAEIEKIGEKVIDWCIKVYGFSKFHGSVSPVLWVQYQSDEENSERRYGEYDSYGNIIYVYSKTNQTVGQIVHTILHEYRHYLQSPTWLHRYQSKYKFFMGGTPPNPYERMAEEFAKRDTERCMKELKLRDKRKR